MYHKIVILGEVRVGKTTLRKTYMGDHLKGDYVKTIGFDFSIKKINEMVFQIWDIAGETSTSTLKGYIEGASATIVMFDKTNLESLLQLEKWFHNIEENLEELCPVIVVGNKIDLLTDDNPGISDKIVQEMYEKHTGGLISRYIETSALRGENVDLVFEWLYEVLRRSA